MKLAIICDDLIQHGGAERVLEAISDTFPDSPVYTSVASNEWLNRFKKKGRIVKTSFLQKFPFHVKLNRYYSPFLLHVLAFESFNLSDFDVVLSCSSRFAHFVITKPETKHICYMHSPGRMIWEPFDYFENEKYGVLRLLKLKSNRFLKLSLSYLRIADFNASKRVDLFVANSKVSRNRIKKYYGRNSEIMYPFFDFENFAGARPEKGDYFLVLTRLVSWKKVDIAIKACNNLNEKLKIVGTGPDLKRLKSLAGPSINFLGYISDEEKIEVLRKCKAVIITQKEDFGIVPLEAMACGKPVIAFEQGGAGETVVEGKTGKFFEKQDSYSLGSVLKDFDPGIYLPTDCINRAREFDKYTFLKKLKNIINV